MRITRFSAVVLGTMVVMAVSLSGTVRWVVLAVWATLYLLCLWGMLHQKTGRT
jgi:hypothetical protein